MNFYFWRFTKQVFILMSAGLFFQACDFINPEEDVPAWVTINQINMSGKYGVGQKPVKITDAWVFVDDKLLGAFELPAKFPVLSAGEHQIAIQGGIEINGIASTRSYYPFYETHRQTINLEEGKEFTALDTVSVSYMSIARFMFSETFDSTVLQLDKISTSDTNIIRTNDEAIRYRDDGVYSGIVNLDDINSSFEIVNTNNIRYDGYEIPVFLEMNYNAEIEFSVGLYVMVSSSSSVRYEHIKIKPTSEWNKIYINFTPKLNEYYAPVYFKIFISGTKGSNTGNAKLLFDNIRLVTFN